MNGEIKVVINCFFGCLIVCVVMILVMLYLKLMIKGIKDFLFNLINCMIWLVIRVVWVM